MAGLGLRVNVCIIEFVWVTFHEQGLGLTASHIELYKCFSDSYELRTTPNTLNNKTLQILNFKSERLTEGVSRKQTR